MNFSFLKDMEPIKPEEISQQPKLEKKKNLFWPFFLILTLSLFFGLLAGVYLGHLYFLKPEVKFPQTQPQPSLQVPPYSPQTSQEEAIVKTVKEVSPAVVSIIITKDLPIIEEYYEEWPFSVPQFRQRIEKREIGGGTGFFVSEDGMILTNRHVVEDKEAEYTVLTNDGRKFPAKVLARDPGQDLAVIKIEDKESFPVVKLGNSDNLQIGQIVITIGNVLGEFRNSVSVGVISGLGRTITASGGGLVETLEDVIQTDAAINRGNSGGPLLNLKGEVIGINTAMAYEAENIGFAIPVNKAKKDIEQVKKIGKIVYPFLGVCWTGINEEVQKELNLPVSEGALIKSGEGCTAAIYPGSAAEKAGLKEGDIILEFNGEKITSENSLGKIIMKYNPGDKITLKILRGGKEKIVEVILGERSE